MRKIVKKRQLFNKKIVLNILLVLFLFLSIGYSALSSNLNIAGIIGVSKYSDKRLYDVLKREVEAGGLAREYTGSHKDSFIEPASKKIYHWYAENNSEGTQILDKNNTIFAGYCWQMIRTTDTGGVKMIYNGAPENGQCLNTRTTQPTVSQGTVSLYNDYYTYWYGTDYTYDSSTQKYTIGGTTEQMFWSFEDRENFNNKYTCLSYDINNQCSTLYYVIEPDPVYGSQSVYSSLVYDNTYYAQISTSYFNDFSSSPSSVGYMYGDSTLVKQTSITHSYSFISTETVLISSSLGTRYYFSPTVDYGNMTANKYSLVNPHTSTVANYPNLVGEYTFRNTSSTYTNAIVYYIAGVSGSTMYYKQFLNGKLLADYEPILFGDSLTDNGDGTYTINNTISSTLTDWYNNYSNYNNKYTCNSSSAVCTNPRYITRTTLTNYNYIDVGEKILIAKSRNGLTLTDTLLVGKKELISNPSNYDDYKYTCGTDSVVCTEDNLKVINYFSSTGFSYDDSHYFGSSVTWDGTNYTLVDPLGIGIWKDDEIATHHFMCLDIGQTTCSSVAFIVYIDFYTTDPKINYLEFTNGETDINHLLDSMFVNTNNSDIKNKVDYWYQNNIASFDQYIEDTIFCNNRRIIDMGGWDPTKEPRVKPDEHNVNLIYPTLLFKENTPTTDLSCENVTDQFSVSNSQAQLTYKVGLATSPEMNLLNDINVRSLGQPYWLLSPGSFDNNYLSSIKYVNQYGDIVSPTTSSIYSKEYGVRPVVSIKYGVEYTGGTGTMADPYIVDTSGN